MKGFVLTREGVVEPSWIDANGHMNVMWYTQVFDSGCDVLLRRVGIDPETIKAGKPTVVAARIQIAHRKELLAGERWELWSGFTRAEPAGVSFTHRLVSGGVTRATCDIQSHAFCPKERSTAKLADGIVEAARQLLVPGLADPFARGA